jgi:uncharacterized protein YjbI with pentapeptide repeats
MNKQIKSILFFSIILISTDSLNIQNSNATPQEIELSCQLLVKDIKDNSCKIRLELDRLVVNIKEEKFEITNDHLLAQTSYGIKNVITVRKFSNLFFVIDSESQNGNRTDVLLLSTKSVFGFMTNSKSYSDLIDQISIRLSAPGKKPFNEIISSRFDNSIKGDQPSQQLQQLLKTKICVRCDLRNANLVSADLRKANLEGANLEGANLSKANLKNAYLVGANLSNTRMDNVKLSDAFLYHASMEKTNLENANLDKANLQEANLSNSILRKSKSSFYVTFSITNLSNADLSNTSLKGANYSYSNLQNANLSNADFSFDSAIDVSVSLFIGANLSNANLTNTNLRRAELTDANLYRANLRDAKLSGSSFKSAKHCQTILPDGKISNTNCQ